jgi:hypothetical protein
MFASIVVKVDIDRPFAEVYEFLAEPLNFAVWAANPGSAMEPLDGGDWLVELPRGKAVIRFAPRNTFGVLDYQVFAPGGSGGPVTPVRLVPNGQRGTTLTVTWFQRDGVTDERFRSDVEWIESDLQRLKTLIEGG